MLGHPVGLATNFPMCMAVRRFWAICSLFQKKKNIVTRNNSGESAILEKYLMCIEVA